MRSNRIACPGISASGISGPHTATLSFVVEENDATIPTALDVNAISALLGGALIQLATGGDSATTSIQVYRSTSNVLDRETDAVGTPLSVEPQSSYATTLGDTTRQELVIGGGMCDASAWALEGGWTISGGMATHTAGTADTISQLLTTTAGAFYRIGYAVAGLIAGSLTPRLAGGSDRPGTAITTDGTYSDRIQTVSGNDTLEFLASSTFDGTLDDVVAYLETSGCLTLGTHYI